MLQDPRSAGRAAQEASEQFDLRDVRGQIEPLVRSFPASRFVSSEGDEYTVAAPVVLEAAGRQGRWIATGCRETCGRRYGGTAAAAWSRSTCRPLSTSTFVITAQRVNTGEGEHKISDDDLSIAYYRDDQIQLGDLVREQLRLAAPMKPLCSDDCRGLCPVCGANRNEMTCDCDTSWLDPRLDRLRMFRPAPIRAALTKKA